MKFKFMIFALALIPFGAMAADTEITPSAAPSPTQSNASAQKETQIGSLLEKLKAKLVKNNEQIQKDDSISEDMRKFIDKFVKANGTAAN